LRSCSARPGNCGATEERDELAPLHVDSREDRILRNGQSLALLRRGGM
jgi:hypothetical protein